ncbi:hypothetical protein BaRGS_00002348 [Batillaria attramentaria]|uniref:Endonuclease/exonuclease/phosphatase domain-containing protein n=1 Tax=Batillaria attramentaria TaxID=370345 RepID=A0ABD0M4I0_9CAEN
MIAVRLSKCLFGLESDVVLLGVYVPPCNSEYYTEIEIENGITMVEQCILDVLEHVGDVELLLCGDFNARTGVVCRVSMICLVMLSTLTQMSAIMYPNASHVTVLSTHLESTY